MLKKEVLNNMDADGLPLVGPGIDYTKCEAIYQKRTLAFLNHFVTHTVRFLNKFSGVCEEKLESLSYRIQRLEIMMNILEAKLSSIPGLENVTVPTTDSSVASQSPAGTSQSSAAAPAAAAQESETSTPKSEPTTPGTTATTPSASSEKPKVTVSQDPKYAKYFKMLSVGVPEPAVKLKMQQEGLDPNLLNNPNAPVPDSGSNKQDKTEDDFSDSMSSEDNSDDDDDDFSN